LCIQFKFIQAGIWSSIKLRLLNRELFNVDLQYWRGLVMGQLSNCEVLAVLSLGQGEVPGCACIFHPINYPVWSHQPSCDIVYHHDWHRMGFPTLTPGDSQKVIGIWLRPEFQKPGDKPVDDSSIKSISKRTCHEFTRACLCGMMPNGLGHHPRRRSPEGEVQRSGTSSPPKTACPRKVKQVRASLDRT